MVERGSASLPFPVLSSPRGAETQQQPGTGTGGKQIHRRSHALVLSGGVVAESVKLNRGLLSFPHIRWSEAGRETVVTTRGPGNLAGSVIG